MGSRRASRTTDCRARKENWWRRRESNPANSMIWALYHQGISHKSAIRRGRCVARVRYHAWGTAIARVAWDQRDHSGLAQRSQPRSMVPTSCSCSGPTAAHVAVALSGQPRWCGSVGPCAATQSVKRESTASSGGASPGSGSDGQRGRRGTVAHLRDLPETWRVAGAGSAIASNASR